MRLISYWIAVLLAFFGILYVRNISSRDPGSWFFDPSNAYTRRYSALRQQEAERFIETASTTSATAGDISSAPLCVGIPSIARRDTEYLRTTVGSLLQGLTKDERDGIYLVVFIAHTDPAVHPAYQEGWLATFVDEVLLYDLAEEELSHVKSMESEHELHREKGLFDYTYLLKRCYAAGTPYIAIIEDDVVALDGWYHRTLASIRETELQSALRHASNEFLYLRMFYTEESLGWNSEDWIVHLSWSLAVFLGSVILVVGVRWYHPGSTTILTPWMSAGICLVLAPATVVLFFAAGKVTVLPMSPGVQEMNNYGCCAQGLIYQRHKAKQLITWFEESRIGFADMLVEQYANDHHEQRWAIVPSVLQHVGTKSSKTDDFGFSAKYSRSVAENIWNFAFELNNVQSLRKEHVDVTARVV